jgi:hypothetical protein
MSLSLINNGDSGLVAREKINDAITAVNNLILSGSTPTQGARGASTWTPVMTNVTQSLTDSNTFSKTAGGSDWNAQVYSTQGYVRGAFVTSQISSTTGFAMVGLDSNPSASALTEDIDYAFYFNNGRPDIQESGVTVFTGTSYTTSSIAYITYDGINVRYFLDDTLLRTTPRSIGSALYLDSSMYTQGLSFINLGFGPMGESATGSVEPVLQFASYQNQTPTVISGSATSAAACSAIINDFQFTTYMTKSGSNIGTGPQVGDLLYTDEAKTVVVPMAQFSTGSFYGYKDGIANAYYEIDNLIGEVSSIGLC